MMAEMVYDSMTVYVYNNPGVGDAICQCHQHLAVFTVNQHAVTDEEIFRSSWHWLAPGHVGRDSPGSLRAHGRKSWFDCVPDA